MMRHLLAGLLDDARGVTAVEYGLLLSLLSLSLIAAWSSAGGSINAKLLTIAGALAS